ncbi:type I restriction enzyme HsdR N-terminal domain-containing protein, partial [Flavihumibacter sp. CACIAM 22H1]|uniref:type I restriction enzyme HsdR N-terminal domain-containing protein n=1 Tax=Flavihumibacter sp. CACIAM 22H1 TaxID=1812911 RepID=UPI0007A7D7D1
KKWLVLTPEEWVRQHFLQYLVQVQQYPSSFIAVEKTVKLGELNKRFDLLVYDRLHQPWLMVECKAMEVPLTESVLHQILRYNLAIPVPFLVITNGKDCVGYHRSNGRLSLLTELPEYL